MEIQSVTPFHQKTERQSSILLESGNLNVSQQESNRQTYNESGEQGDKEGFHQFGLDLELPHPDHYLPETVDFPSSPSAMMRYRVEEGESHETGERPQHNDAVNDSEDEQSIRAVIGLNKSVILKKENESSDSANASDTEEYFEDFHLPITHQNSMSTRRSFMRKIKSVDIQVPDADKIEGIVKSGQLNRHGSIRRKIVPQPQDFANDSLYSDQSEPSPVKFTSTPNETFAELDLANDTLYIPSVQQEETSMLTPYSNEELKKDVGVTPSEVHLTDGMSTELAPLDDATLIKIKECLDSEKMKDIYTLGSTLQDLLSATEIEEILNNSHRYGSVIGRDLLIALSESRLPAGVEATRNEAALMPFSTSDPTTAPPDLIDSQDMRHSQRAPRVQMKIRKRISLTDDMARTREDDSDTEINLSFNGMSFTDDENVPVANTEHAESESISQSESFNSSPVEVWDLSPKSVSISEGLETSIAERMVKPDLIPETLVQDERDEERNWRSVVIMGLERKIDLKVIEPYKKVLSHGGYQGSDCQTAVIVFSACFLPDRSRVDYDYVMEHLFLYVLTTLDQLVAEDYVLIYFHGATPKGCIPRFSWVKNCYQMIDRRLRKNLKRLYLVHPTLWLKAAVLMCRPFISTKFSRKIMYIPNLPSLSAELPIDHVCIPDRVKQYDMLKESLMNG